MFNVQNKKMQKIGRNKSLQYLKDKQGTERSQGKWDRKTEERPQEVKDSRRIEKKS